METIAAVKPQHFCVPDQVKGILSEWLYSEFASKLPAETCDDEPAVESGCQRSA